jgi:hypothetical protein
VAFADAGRIMRLRRSARAGAGMDPYASRSRGVTRGVRRQQQRAALWIDELWRAGATWIRRISPSRLWFWREAALGRRWVRRLLIALAACAVSAAGAGAATHVFDKDPRVAARTPETAEITSAGLRLRAPSTWSRSSARPQLPGFTSANAVVLVDAFRKTRLIAALLPATSSTLLPQAFLERLHDPPQPPERVSLGGRLSAYYYSGIALVDTPGTHDVYVTPTTEGVATVVCFGENRLGSPLQECWRAANSLVVTRGAPVRLTGNSAFLLRLGGEIRNVDAARERARFELVRATTPDAQFAAALGVSSAYERAAAVLAPLAQQATLTRIVAQLRTNAATYRRISTDLEAQDTAALAADRELALAGEARLKAFLSDQPT